MTDENEKKPFYKRNWFWITIFSIFIIVSATTYVANYSFYQGKADQASTSQSKDIAKKKIENDPSLITRYNSIKTGKKGYSKDEVIKLLGVPSSSQQIDQNNQLMNLNWEGTADNSEITVQIIFEKDKATAKSIQGLSIDRKKLLTTEDFDKLQDGDSYNHVINVLGDPDDYSDSNGIKTLTYESDLAEADPSQDAVIKIEIANNKLVYKVQQNLK